MKRRISSFYKNDHLKKSFSKFKRIIVIFECFYRNSFCLPNLHMWLIEMSQLVLLTYLYVYLSIDMIIFLVIIWQSNVPFLYQLHLQIIFMLHIVYYVEFVQKTNKKIENCYYLFASTDEIVKDCFLGLLSA